MKKPLPEKIVVVSVGRHTRLGDVLERALEGVAFETTDADTLSSAEFRNRRLLFAVSADQSGENAAMRALTVALSRAQDCLDGCVCALLADGEQGGEVQVDARKLLLRANASGAQILPKPLLESGTGLKRFSDGRDTPFERYCAAARALVERLAGYEPVSADHPHVRLVTLLADGAASDWRMLLGRIAADVGGQLSDGGEEKSTILLCENNTGLPDEATLSLLDGSGRIRFWIASPEDGSELYLLALLERACVRGSYALAPRGVAVFDGLNAVEAIADQAEAARIRKLSLF